MIVYGFLYFVPSVVSLPSRTASFRPEANSTAVPSSAQKRRRSASPDVGSDAKRRNISSSSSEISPAKPKPPAPVELTPPPAFPSTSASLSALRRMVREDHGVSWTDHEVKLKTIALNHNSFNI